MSTIPVSTAPAVPVYVINGTNGSDYVDPLPVTISGVVPPITGTVTANQGTSPWVISGTVTGPLTDTQLRLTPVPVSGSVTANAGLNLNTSALALDSTVAKDASLVTLNTSVNTLLKPANTLAAVTTLGTITNVVHIDDNSGSLTVDNNGTFPVQSTLAAETTKVIGTVNQGTSPWAVSAASLPLPTGAATDTFNSSGTQGAVSVTNAATLISANGSTNLANRKTLTAYNNSGTQATLYFGFTNGVTTSTGTPLIYGQFVSIAVGPAVSVYMIAASSTHDVRVTEGA